MKTFTTEEIDSINKLGFFWNATGSEFFSDQGDYEMGIYRDADLGIVLRSRKWDDDFCEYKDDYELFGSVKELLTYLT
jgi:hypothetical protein